MCYYMNGFSRQSHLGDGLDNLGFLSSHLLSRFVVEGKPEDDNRGSGR